jgi:predicted nucleic acid-binding protein
LTSQDIVYLDAGPIVSLASNDDRFHTEVRASLASLSGDKVTSLFSCLEAWVVLRRENSMKVGTQLNSATALALWDGMTASISEASVLVKPAPLSDLFDEAGVREIRTFLSATPLLQRSKDPFSRPRGVGVMDAVHLKSGRSMGATHFLTTDRCLAAVDSEMQMILVGSYSGQGSTLIRPAYLDMSRSKVESGGTE